MARLDDIDLVGNNEQRTPCVLLLDVSGSMDGEPISELNRGLQVFEQEVKADPLTAMRCEVAIVTFGETVNIVQDFVTVDQFTAPRMAAGGKTPLGQAIGRALDELRIRKEAYKRNGVNYTRPWMFVITDGAPTDTWEPAADRLRQEETAKGVVVYPIGVKGADASVLARLSGMNSPLWLQGFNFSAYFQWLSASVSRASQGTASGAVQLPSPSGWAQAPI
jgi:uncharacterized protein YegL